MSLFAFGLNFSALRQRQPAFVRIANRWHKRSVVRFAFGVRGSALPPITHVRFAVKSGNVIGTFLTRAGSAILAISGRGIKVSEMSFSHSQRLNADQPPKKRIFTRLIAWVAMISGLLSFVLPFILDFVSRLFRYMRPIDFLVVPSSPVAALVGVALGLLSLILGWKGPKTFRLAVIGILTGVVWFFVVWILFAGGGGINR